MSKSIALLELGLAAIAFNTAQRQDSPLKLGLYATAAYLLLGSYLNFKGRVQLIDSQ